MPSMVVCLSLMCSLATSLLGSVEGCKDSSSASHIPLRGRGGSWGGGWRVGGLAGPGGAAWGGVAGEELVVRGGGCRVEHR